MAKEVTHVNRYGAGPRAMLWWRFIAAPLGLVAAVTLWWLLSSRLPTYILPSPSIVARSFVEAATGQYLVKDILETTYTATAGLCLASVIAVLLAVVFVLFRHIEATVYPIVIALRSVPAVAAAPILIIWTGTGTPMKIIVAAFVAFFPILVNLLHGLTGPPEGYSDQFAVWATSKVQVLWYLRIPWALSSFFAALKIAVTYALIGSFVAELMGSQKGLGRMVVTAYYHFDTAKVIVGIICFAALGMLLFGLTVCLERMILKRFPTVS